MHAAVGVMAATVAVGLAAVAGCSNVGCEGKNKSVHQACFIMKTMQIRCERYHHHDHDCLPE